MGVSKYNSEGYYDPTAYEALAKITQEEKAARYRPLVYICSPYSGDTEGNTEKARRYSRFAADAGTIPIAPHLLLPQFLSEETERELAIFKVFVIADRFIIVLLSPFGIFCLFHQTSQYPVLYFSGLCIVKIYCF